jgi:hypothetical protein
MILKNKTIKKIKTKFESLKNHGGVKLKSICNLIDYFFFKVINWAWTKYEGKINYKAYLNFWGANAEFVVEEREWEKKIIDAKYKECLGHAPPHLIEGVETFQMSS